MLNHARGKVRCKMAALIYSRLSEQTYLGNCVRNQNRDNGLLGVRDRRRHASSIAFDSHSTAYDGSLSS